MSYSFSATNSSPYMILSHCVLKFLIFQCIAAFPSLLLIHYCQLQYPFTVTILWDTHGFHYCRYLYSFLRHILLQHKMCSPAVIQVYLYNLNFHHLLLSLPYLPVLLFSLCLSLLCSFLNSLLLPFFQQVVYLYLEFFLPYTTLNLFYG